MSKMSVSTLSEIAIIAAICMVLSFIPADIAWYQISLGCLPLAILSLRRGLGAGLSAGFIWGLLHIVMGTAYILSPVQLILEYFLAFMFMGLAGLVANKFQATLSLRPPYALRYYSLAAAIGCFAKYLTHFIAGYIFWGHYAPEGTSPVIYSLAVNGVSGALTFVYLLIAGGFLLKRYPQLFLDR
ncbi:energy-coupled thiamine transporter ThiT [Aerococcaceae bacterium DSM 111020]|nr:energy-coupled thiamine transporter ThiT [Aerococcaceae bacterium DSM 111020]